MQRPWLLEIEIDKKSNKAIYLQIADLFIGLINKKILPANDPIPSSRQLATQLKVNRNTVVKALEILQLEGWLYSEERRGIFVSDLQSRGKKMIISSRANDEVAKPFLSPVILDDGLPDTRLAPITELARAYRQLFSRKAKWQLMNLDDKQGSLEFRESIARMLNWGRRMEVHSSQVCITRGSQMALFLIAHSLIKNGDLVLVESPGFKPAWNAFEHAGATLIPISVDSYGVNVDAVEEFVRSHKVKAIYVTPHRQYPTTVTLSLERRFRLLELSQQYNFTIIEDDYDSEFHFGQRPMMPISALDGAINCIYIGTFSKLIAPSIRVGYLVANAELVDKISSLRQIIDIQGDSIMEQAIQELIEVGVIKRHKKRVLGQYKLRCDNFTNLLDTHLKEEVTYNKPDGGLAIWLQFKEEKNIEELMQDISQERLKIVHPSKYSMHSTTNGLRVGYASLSEEEQEKAILLLKQYL